MKKVYFILLLLLTAIFSYADVLVTLKSGSSITGTIVFQNDEVLVLKSIQGQRFQYPMAEIESIKEDIIVQDIEDNNLLSSREKKVGVVLQLSGGAGLLPNYNTGGNISADVIVGVNNLFDRQIFIGGGIGYEAFMMPSVFDEEYGKNYSFIPLQVAISVPLMQTMHAPAIGFSLGYGFSTKGIHEGGLSASFDLGYRYQISKQNAVFAGLTAAIQQGRLSEYKEVIEELTYISSTIYSFWRLGIKVSIQL